MKKLLFLSIATGFGLGYSPFTPGTIGSLPGFILVFLLSKLSYPVQIMLIIFLFSAGIFICNTSLQWFKEKDPHAMTIDEIVSLPVTFFMIPLSATTIITGFILNRILDILKPWPAYQSQSLPEGYGIMTDDLISGIYANILLQIIISLCHLN